jgi:ArsR family transcriptional regulator
MGATKTTHFTDRQNEMAALMKALGHPARIAILEFLIQTPGCICGDIVDVLPLAQPTVSQHLKELKQAGLIAGNVEGTAICYCIDTNNWFKFKDILNALFDLHKPENNCC